MLAYSARKNRENLKPLYSVWNPATSSDLRFGQIEWRAIRFGDAANKEKDESDRLKEDVPDAGVLLRFDDAHQAERSREHQTRR